MIVSVATMRYNGISLFVGLYHQRKCPKGRHCNFLHVFRNPGDEFRNADLDISRMLVNRSSRRQSRSPDRSSHRSSVRRSPRRGRSRFSSALY